MASVNGFWFFFLVRGGNVEAARCKRVDPDSLAKAVGDLRGNTGRNEDRRAPWLAACLLACLVVR